MARVSARSFARPVLWAALCVGTAAIVVATTRTGVDVLALLVAGFLLLVVERTVGDWLAETLGPLPTALLFALVAASGALYFQTDAGRRRAERVFEAAEARGYHTAYFRVGEERTRARQRSATDAVAAALPAPTGRSVSDPPITSPPGQAPSVVAPPAPMPESSRPIAQGARIARLRAEPEVTVIDQEVVLTADLLSDTPGTLPQVEFSVDRHVIASVAPVDGVATVRWRTRVPGQYAVRAGLAGSQPRAVQKSILLTVLPPRR